MKSSNSVTTLEIVRVRPFSDSLLSDFSLPLTFFDIHWLKVLPTDIIFYYKLTESTPNFFNSVILPKIKHSLSRALLHFFPIAGNLVWLPSSSLPSIVYTSSDAVSLTVAESNADFHHLSLRQTRRAADSLSYIPELEVTESKASIISLKITNFPNQGFCIGVSAHHAVMDGKSISMFMKSWVHIHFTNQAQLSPNLIPSYDRSSIPDPDGASGYFLKKWFSLKWPNLDTNPRSLNLIRVNPPDQEMVISIFEFSKQNAERLRRKILSRLHSHQPINLSNFVVALAYTLICRGKARKQGGSESSDNERVTLFMIPADCRGRLGVPLSANYFGNCIGGYEIMGVKEALVAEGDDDDGLTLVAKGISDVVIGLHDRAVEKAILNFKKRYELPPGGRIIGVTGSPRFELYECDFGWGKPLRVENASIVRTGSISMMDSRDGESEIEVGLALKKSEMEIFRNLFVNGLTGCEP